jgi:hypothetical protein
MKLEFLYLYFYLFASYAVVCQCGEVYTITRSSDDSYDDIFEVPASNCTTTGSECTTYNEAYYHSNCNCACPYAAGTFGYYNGSWTCLDDTELRQQTGSLVT